MLFFQWCIFPVTFLFFQIIDKTCLYNLNRVFAGNAGVCTEGLTFSRGQEAGPECGMTNRILHRKLDQARDQCLATIMLRYTVKNSLVAVWVNMASAALIITLHICHCILQRPRAMICSVDWMLLNNKRRESEALLSG